MRLPALFLVLFLLGACASHGPTPYAYPVEEEAAPEWSQGQQVELVGTLWPSRSHTKYDITTDDGRSAHLRGHLIEQLGPGTKVLVIGQVDCVNTYGTAGASDVAHNQTYMFINVKKFKVVQEAAWDIEFQNAVDHDSPDYSLR